MNVEYALKVLRKKRASLTRVIAKETDFWQTCKDDPYYHKLYDRLNSVDRAIYILEAWKG